jgi:hypothetical protein
MKVCLISLALHGYWKHITKEKSFLGPSLNIVGCLGVECRELGKLSCEFLVGIMDNPYAKSAQNVLAINRECIDGVYGEYLYIDKCFSNYSQYTLSLL